MLRILCALSLVFIVAACATSPDGRSQLVPPSPLLGFSAVYSEFDMRLKLVTAADAPLCGESECVAEQAFDQRILGLGQRLADAAYRLHPDLHQRFPRFEFMVADKADAGTASSAGGAVVIYRGVRRLNLDDGALAFVLAREMSHVIGGHDHENAFTSILVAVAAQILLPVLNILPSVTAVVSGSAATNAAASAGSAATATAMASAASFAGSRALRASYRPRQVREAETIAMKLLAAAGWNGREVSDQLEALRPPVPEEPSWTEELRESTQRMASLMQGPVLPKTQWDKGVLGQVALVQPDLPPPVVSEPF